MHQLANHQKQLKSRIFKSNNKMLWKQQHSTDVKERLDCENMALLL